MHSMIYHGEVMHHRLRPVRHRFTYAVYYFALDLDEVKALAHQTRLFGYNQRRLFSLYDTDYLQPGTADLRSKVVHLLHQQGSSTELRKIYLVTVPRFLKHVFNPVSFFYCYDKDENIRHIIADVNNTFSEKHIYILNAEDQNPYQKTIKCSQHKSFHVSPFFDLSYTYEFSFSTLDNELDIRMHMTKNNQKEFISRLTGSKSDFTKKNLLKMIYAYHLTPILTMPRILWQAAMLKWRKKLSVFTKPVPQSPMTVRVRAPRLFEQLAMHIVWIVLRRMQHDRLRVILPDGAVQTFGPQDATRQHTMMVRDYSFFSKMLWGRSIGFGESYTQGAWDCPDLTALLEFFVKNLQASKRRWNPFGMIMAGVHAIKHRLNRNTLKNSQKNIASHYDMGNEFFAQFLDKTMTYSCAIFAHATDTLEQAQDHKLNNILTKLDVNAHHHILEIGFGWGSFALQAVRETGCRVTGITLSNAQLTFAQNKLVAEGLQEHIHFTRCDYRHIQGVFDRIVSIEMAEAVGHAYLTTFFRQCDHLLAEDGKLVLQVIIIPHERYHAYRNSSDWVRKHIFPGGHLPSLPILEDIIASKTGLTLTGIEHIGSHYATTLNRWQERFTSAWPAIKELGFSDDTQRTWSYYFSYCAAGFAQGHIDAVQLELVKDPQT